MPYCYLRYRSSDSLNVIYLYCTRKVGEDLCCMWLYCRSSFTLTDKPSGDLILWKISTRCDKTNYFCYNPLVQGHLSVWPRGTRSRTIDLSVTDDWTTVKPIKHGRTRCHCPEQLLYKVLDPSPETSEPNPRPRSGGGWPRAEKPGPCLEALCSPISRWQVARTQQLAPPGFRVCLIT